MLVNTSCVSRNSNLCKFSSTMLCKYKKVEINSWWLKHHCGIAEHNEMIIKIAPIKSQMVGGQI